MAVHMQARQLIKSIQYNEDDILFVICFPICLDVCYSICNITWAWYCPSDSKYIANKW